MPGGVFDKPFIAGQRMMFEGQMQVFMGQRQSVFLGVDATQINPIPVVIHIGIALGQVTNGENGGPLVAGLAYQPLMPAFSLRL